LKENLALATPSTLMRSTANLLFKASTKPLSLRIQAAGDKSGWAHSQRGRFALVFFAVRSRQKD
jgi:hypothetical protein